MRTLRELTQTIDAAFRLDGINVAAAARPGGLGDALAALATPASACEWVGGTSPCKNVACDGTCVPFWHDGPANSCYCVPELPWWLRLLQELLETLIDMLAGLIALGVLALIIALIVAQPELAVVIILAAIATKESGGSDDDARKAAERAAVDA